MKEILQEMCNMQRVKLLRIANEILPHVTSEDIMQPNDFQELETNTFFRYEEGVLEGLQSALSAIQYEENSSPCSKKFKEL
ncbi:MAG: hypothetical protein P0S95_03835 [Rhabdochlamydiaceae bacterium]|nr:hypothetical protein [Candidatus Amphrikana amoebophyrae]